MSSFPEKGYQNPTISVVIPAFNQARYLKDAIKSVCSQTFHDLEIIVVDDGSTDETAIIAKEFQYQIHYIHQDNMGLAGARNTGINNSKGEYIALLDSDDQWLPGFLTKMTEVARQNPNGSVFYCQAQCMDAEGRNIDQIVGGLPIPSEEMYSTLLRANILIPSTILIKKSVIMGAGMFDQSLRSCEDWDLWLRLLPQNIFIGLNDILVRYRIHNMSLSKNLDGMHKAAQAVIVKKCGCDDGQLDLWSSEKRRAYGGLYRYKTITFILRQENWEAAANELSRALQIDPSLSEDLNLFYDLALGSQPIGWRGSSKYLDLELNAKNISKLLGHIFGEKRVFDDGIRRSTYGTANFALGLVAYNTGNMRLCRTFLAKAIFYHPGLSLKPILVGDLLKSVLGNTIVKKASQFKAILRR